MAYAQKYLFRWDSSNGTTREIRILKDGYTGGVIQRALGRAPILKKQQSGPVCGTSLEIYAECLVDSEFAEFYVTDPKAYRVELYEGARLLWTGFVTPELYAEPDIAPPYDVQIVATDGVGELKLYGHQAQGTRSLRQIFTYLLSYTGVGTDLQLISSLKVDGAGPGELLDKYINLDYLSGKTCYEVLTYLLTTLHATITRWGSAWIICRETNVIVQDGAVQCFALDGGPVSLHDSVKALGKLSVNEIWPVGQLTQKVEPARRSVTVQAPWHTVNRLLNPEMTADAHWTTENNAFYLEKPGCFVLPWNGISPTLNTACIYQSATMQGLRIPMTLRIKYTGLDTIRIESQSGTTLSNGVVGILLTYTIDGTTYYLRRGEEAPTWGPGNVVDPGAIDGSIIDYQTPVQVINADRISAQELSIENIPAFEQDGDYPSGVLTVYIGGYNCYLYGARLDAQLPKGYQDRLHLANGARGEGDTVEVAFGRVTADASYYKEFLSGVLLDGDKLVTAYQDAVLTEPTDYLSFISRDYARSIALPRIKRTGVVYLERSVHYPPLMLSQGAVDYWLETWSWNLCEDELDISATSLPVAVIEVESEVIAEASGGSASSGSSSSSSASITTSGGASFFERGDSNEVRLRASYELLTAPALSLGQTFNERPSLLSYDPDSDAWHLSGNLLVDGFITAGGKGESSSGGGSADYTQWGWDDIIQLTSDPGLGNLASAWALKQEYDSRQSALSVLSQGLSSIRLLIPSSASESNQLADKEFVNSSIASNTATFRGTFEGVSYLPSGAKLNDYAFVIATDASGNPEYNRYKYTSSGWVFEYTLNNSSFTAEQWSAITSGITANLVSLYSGHIANRSNPHAVTKAQIGLGDVENIKLSSWEGSTSITTLGAVTTGEWKASKIANDYLVNSAIRIGSTTVALGGAIEALSGISFISLKGNNEAKLTYDNGAWHLSGNLLVDGYITAGGVGSSSGGGGIDSAAMWALLGDATNEQINKTHISSALEGYQTIIPGLETIRSNAANGNTAYGWGNHSGLYLPLTGGTMSNTNVVNNLNADLLDGYHASTFLPIGSWDDGVTVADWDKSTMCQFNAGKIMSVSGWAWAHSKHLIVGNYSIDSQRYSAIKYRTGNLNDTWQQSAFLFLPTYAEDHTIFVAQLNTTTDANIVSTNVKRYEDYDTILASNVASASKWATPRTITLTGSVTGSVSIDGSGDVSLATNTNHTHAFASLTSKPTTLSGYGITDAYTASTIDSKLSGYLPLSGGTITGLLTINTNIDRSLILDEPTGEKYHVISFRASGEEYAYLSSNYLGSENLLQFNGSNILHEGNYNSYAPKLDGIGASGTWNINISGNAETATKLQTPHTIWGQSFDGTGNVSGALTGVTDITASGIVGCSNLMLPYGGKIYNGGNFGFFGLYINDSAVDYGSAIYLTHDHGANQTAFRINSHYDSGLGGLSIGFSTTAQNYGASPIDATYAEIIHIRGNGNVGIGTTSPSEKLHVIGNILASGAITAGTASDSRLKSNIATLCNASSVLRQLRGVGFDWNTLATDKSSYFKGHDVGLIAQEVEPLIPSAIGTIWGEYKRLDYTKITPYLVEGWKEHDDEIQRLKTKIKQLEERIYELGR